MNELQLGNVTYNQQELLSILSQPVRGNGLVLLAHQLIAAKLNIADEHRWKLHPPNIGRRWFLDRGLGCPASRQRIPATERT